jgi:hypothetical protein
VCCARLIIFGGSEYAVEMLTTMVEFARMQNGRHIGMQGLWSSLLPRVKGMNASATNGCSFLRRPRH